MDPCGSSFIMIFLGCVLLTLEILNQERWFLELFRPVSTTELVFAGLPTSDEDTAAQVGSQNIVGSLSGGEGNSLPTIALDSPKKDKTDFETADCILKHKSVFKCRLCPRIVCLSEETLKAHLSSKVRMFIAAFLNSRWAYNVYLRFFLAESFVFTYLCILAL